MDIIEKRKGYKMTYKELLYLLYYQTYECFRTENNKKWLNSEGRCMLMVLTYLNTLGTHGGQVSRAVTCRAICQLYLGK